MYRCTQKCLPTLKKLLLRDGLMSRFPTKLLSSLAQRGRFASTAIDSDLVRCGFVWLSDSPHKKCDSEP
jgi:hypothetical protein